MLRDRPDQGKSIGPCFPPRASDTRNLALSATRFPRQGHTQGMGRGVSLVAQPVRGQGASSFSCSTPVKTVNPDPGHLSLETSSGNSTSGTKLRRGISLQPDRALHPEQEKRAAPPRSPLAVPRSPLGRAPFFIL